jgi:hypothetical protein
VTFAEVCPSIRDNASTFAPELIFCTLARFTAPANRCHHSTDRLVCVIGIIMAPHELILRESTFSQMVLDLADAGDGKVGRRYSQRESDGVGAELRRITIVDVKCFELMGIAYNEFMKIKSTVGDIEKLETTPDSLRQAVQPLNTYTRQLNRQIADLVVAAQVQVSPGQSRRNKRERKDVRARLEAEYFDQSRNNDGQGMP